MGYNTAFLMIESVSAAEAMDVFASRFDAADLFASPGESISFDVAASQSLHPNLALGEMGGWAIFWDPSAKISWSVSGFPAAAAKERCVLYCLLQDCDSFYGFEYFVNGVMQRSITYRDDHVYEEYGVALPEEAGLAVPVWGSDESFVFGVMERLTGVSFTDLAVASYQRLEFLG